MIGYVHVPKTGESTLELVLRSSFGVCHCDTGFARRRQPAILCSKPTTRLARLYHQIFDRALVREARARVSARADTT